MHGRATPLDADSSGGAILSSESGELFGLIAELAIGLAGFAGVAAAFAGRERAFQPSEKIRLLALFLNSSTILTGCGGVLILPLAGVGPEATLTVVGSGAIILFGIPGVFWNARAYRVAREPGSSSEAWALHLTSVYLLVAVACFAGAALAGSASLLATGFWIQLVYSLWMFWRLLTRPN